MAYETRVVLKGSERKPLPGSKEIGPIDLNQVIQVTVVLRRRQTSASTSSTNTTSSTAGISTPISREDYGVINGADPNALNAVEEFAHEFGLTVSERNQSRRSVVLSGTIAAMQNAFGTKLSLTQSSTTGISHRSRTGSITLPQELASSVLAVLGLDNRPAAKPHFRRKAIKSTTAASNTNSASTDSSGAFTPLQLAQLYNFPSGVNGAGQTIAILELGGGYRTADLKTYFQNLGLTEPKISAVSVGNGSNQPGSDADAEVMLDIEVAGAIANGSRIVVYFAENTDQGFHNAIAAATHDNNRQPSILSISWGGPENNWTEQALNAINSALEDAAGMGLTVTVASGDDGATDNSTDGTLQVDFPSSSPFVLGCGGTKVTAANGKISTDVVWNELASNNGATGGGVSRMFSLPQYQTNAGVPLNSQTNQAGRGVPDVSGDADPETGYLVRVDGQDTVIGGTSAVAPLWAGLIALINQQLGKPLGFANPALYRASNASNSFVDITQGNIGAYSATKGWDCCTGLGSPNATALVKALQGAQAAKTS